MPTSTTGDFVTAPSTLGNIGLLVIRLGVGATMLHFGLRQFLDFGSTIEALRSDGWRAPIVAKVLVIAVVAGILTWVVLNGNNPIHLTTPEG